MLPGDTWNRNSAEPPMPLLERKCNRTMTGVPGRAVLGGTLDKSRGGGIKREEAEDTESRAVSLLLQKRQRPTLPPGGAVPCSQPPLAKAAAAYSPTWWGSTIGAAGLNFSVRYG